MTHGSSVCMEFFHLLAPSRCRFHSLINNDGEAIGVQFLTSCDLVHAGTQYCARPDCHCTSEDSGQSSRTLGHYRRFSFRNGARAALSRAASGCTRAFSREPQTGKGASSPAFKADYSISSQAAAGQRTREQRCFIRLLRGVLSWMRSNPFELKIRLTARRDADSLSDFALTPF